MPRDSSTGIYTIYPGTHGIPNTAIESALYNTNVDDVALDLNTPRPIVAGGTGATSAPAALAALSGETANQIVTNYDSDTILPGSFSSATTASGAPVAAHAFAGICYIAGTSKVLEARDLNDGKSPPTKWVRTFVSPGPWSAWAQEGPGLVDADARFVNTAGDTMTGNLVIAPTSGVATLILNKSASGSNSTYYGTMANKNRWTAEFGDNTAESGGNAGSNFTLNRYDDAGSYIGTPISINRANGAVTIPSLVISALGVTAGAQVTDYNLISGMGPIYSLTSATNSPVAAHAYNGHVYGQDLNNLVVEVRDLSAYTATAPSSVPAWVGTPPTFFNRGQLARDTADNTIWIALNDQIANYGGTFAAYRAANGNILWALVQAADIRYIRIKQAGVWGGWINATGNGTLVTDFNNISALGPIYALTTTTNGPIAGHAFNGTVYGQDASNLVVEAYDLNAAVTVAPWFGGPPTQSFSVGNLARDTADNSVWVCSAAHVVNYTGTFAQARQTIIPNQWTFAARSLNRYSRVKSGGTWGAWIAT